MTTPSAPVQTPTLADLEAAKFAPEGPLLDRLVAQAALSDAARAAISASGADLVRRLRAQARPGLMEVFLAEYGLSTEEGVALMCLAEALLRVPDAETMDDLIEDKIAPSDWGKHAGHSSSPLVNASTWGLMLTGKVLEEREPGLAARAKGLVKRLGEPVIRAAVGRAMKEMGRQFVLGETIEGAMDRAAKMEAKGYAYSYDMLGEAAMTGADAEGYFRSYKDAIASIAKRCKGRDIRRNPGISVKLSAIHPRYEVAKRERVMAELVPRLAELCCDAAAAGMGLNVDAEEADRLELSLAVMEAALADPALAGWNGFGAVVQAYGRRAGLAIDVLYGMAERLDRRITLRLVKGAYWDTEIKHAQVEGLEDFPVFTKKPATDVSYIANARKLLGMTDRIYPQFATHNAHTIAAVLHMAEGMPRDVWEFQRLHGMGEGLHEIVRAGEGTMSRIYAPVGKHRDLLAYLVRRLLENGANSSFVNQVVDEDVAPEVVAACPFAALDQAGVPLARADEVFEPLRGNSRGYDLTRESELARIETARGNLGLYRAAPLIAGACAPEAAVPCLNPTNGEAVGWLSNASAADVEVALAAATPWAVSPEARAEVLLRAADLYEENFGPIFALLAREAGKTMADAVGELREAADFLRYYAREGLAGGAARGTFVCISPWNFPLAIFTGQVAAALATGNAVIAKPAEQAPLIAHLAVGLLHEAGVPVSALQYLPGSGEIVGAALTSDARVSGVAFTGSTETAQVIRRAMAANMVPGTPLIAETGGLNAMIVDSTALPEQAVRDVVASAFQSAGQRCSALRCLYVQEDVADRVITMIEGAMDELALSDPWEIATDVGPLIDAEAYADVQGYVDAARAEGRVLKQLDVPEGGHFAGPALLRVGGIADLGREVFGPVLHVATFRASELDRVISDINATGYGLTFGLHSRMDNRVQHVAERVHAGNIYVNRNQIGAIVASQPFGGEGLSGTGPKAGGPNYLARFRASGPGMVAGVWEDEAADLAARLAGVVGVGAEIAQVAMPGPTGELNRLELSARAPVLCLGPGAEVAAAQVAAVEALGGLAVAAGGAVAPEALTALDGLSAAIWWGGADQARAYEAALAARTGAILPLITGMPDQGHAAHERHLCVDTTAAGGNTALLAGEG